MHHSCRPTSRLVITDVNADVDRRGLTCTDGPPATCRAGHPSVSSFLRPARGVGVLEASEPHVHTVIPAVPATTARRTGRLRSGLAATAVAAVSVAGLALGSGSAAAATTVTVLPADLVSCTTTTSICEFERGQGTASIVADTTALPGAGALQLSTPRSAATDNPAASDKASVFSQQFAGRKLSEITTLQYQTYIDTLGEIPFQAPALNLTINPNKANDTFSTLVWEPYYAADPAGSNPIISDTVQTWNPSIGVTGRGGWWASDSVTGPGTENKYGFTTYTATFAEVQAALPDAVVAQVGVNQGGGNPQLTSLVDGLVVNDTTYDFEQVAPLSTVVATSGNNQSAVAGTAFAQPLSVTLTDTRGNPVSGAPVTFAVTSGSATFASTAAATTNASGVATSSTLTAGSTAGPVTVTASSGGKSATFNETVVAAPLPPAVGPADLSLQLAATPFSDRGANIPVSVTVKNNGTNPSGPTTATVGFFPGLQISETNGLINAQNGTVTFAVPYLAPGASQTFTLTATGSAGFRIAFAGGVVAPAAGQADPSFFNNLAVVPVITR